MFAQVLKYSSVKKKTENIQNTQLAIERIKELTIAMTVGSLFF